MFASTTIRLFLKYSEIVGGCIRLRTRVTNATKKVQLEQQEQQEQLASQEQLA